LLGITEVSKKIGKELMTNSSKFRVGNIGPACYSAVGAWLSNFCTLGASSVKNGVSTKKERSFENRGRKVKEKWRPGSKRADCCCYFLKAYRATYYFFIFLVSI